MAFKNKTKNRLLIDERQTLDAKHNNILKSFTNNKDNLNNYYKELNKINNKLIELNNKNASEVIINIELQQKIWDYDDKKKEIENEIYKIENNIEQNEYMLKTGKLINNYYNVVNQEHNYNTLNENENAETENAEDDNIKDDNVKDDNYEDENSEYNNTEYENLDVNEYKDENLDDNNNKDENDILNTILNNNDNKIVKNINKDIIYDKFMKLIDKNYINTTNDSKNKNYFDKCIKCSIEMLLNNNSGQLTCPNCGYIENIIVDSDKPSFKEPPKEMTSFCYKRINHLNEFLAQFQAKETTDIPETVYNDIIVEIKKERIKNMSLITPDKMRIILKKIKKNDYYEHIPYIINQLNGLPPPVIAPEIEEIIRGMFKAIQIPFEKYCPVERKNFLSYNYVMYKFFELLELDEYLACFQLLKSRTKLHQQDQIWKNICKDLNWEYINSL
jgi:predicted RNA-binding Zn-ribbon protein involved in translation (DUF1610 family)